MLPQFTIRQDRVAKTTESWRQWAEEREVDEWIQHCAAVLDQGWNDACVPETKQNEFIILTPFLVPLSPVLHDHTSFRRVSTLTLASNDSRLESSSSGTRRPSLYAVSLGAMSSTNGLLSGIESESTQKHPGLDYRVSSRMRR